MDIVTLKSRDGKNVPEVYQKTKKMFPHIASKNTHSITKFRTNFKTQSNKKTVTKQNPDLESSQNRRDFNIGKSLVVNSDLKRSD